RCPFHFPACARRCPPSCPGVADARRASVAGDPTIFGNFGPPPEAVAAVRESLDSGRYNGYAPCAGYKEAREAVANYVSYPNAEVEFKDVVLCSGCSSALEMCITALCDPGQNLLVPRPGFALYRTLAESIGVHIRSYNLMPERGWEADLRHLEQQADARTAALLINNPSNPCGSVWRPQHLRDLLQLARRLRLPVIADEIYEHLVFPGERFVPMASLTSEVPILSCGGLTKRFMVPGWRMGWIIRKALNMLSQRTIGSNTIVQGALPAILENKHKTFFEDTSRTLQEHAALVFGLLSRIEGLRPVMPQGAMYMMVGLRLQDFPAIACELTFVERLMAEESLREACERIAAFCLRHRQPQPASASAAADLVGLPFVQEPRAAAAGGYGNP
ncbi:Tyrosine aminotransferase, partial [Gryllus bimaculatus]